MNTWEEVYIIGGGTSIKEFDITLLKDKFTLGVNDSALKLNTNALFSLDSNWIHRRFNDYLTFPGEKVFATPAKTIQKDPNATYLKRESCKEGLSTNSLCIHGSNSGFGALNLAYLKGARRIILLGYDFYNKGKESHWHGGYPWGHKARSGLYDTWAGAFKKASLQLDKAGIMVINASLNSKIECFRKVDFDELGILIRG